jgi:hypothetical protein
VSRSSRSCTGRSRRGRRPGQEAGAEAGPEPDRTRPPPRAQAAQAARARGARIPGHRPPAPAAAPPSERAQVGPGDLGGDRPLPAEAGVYVAGPGHPVHEGIPAQLAGQQGGPGPGRILRPHPRGERRADDHDGRYTAPSVRPKPPLAPCQQRGLARVGRLGRRRTGSWRTWRRVDGRRGRGDQQQNERADCDGGCRPPETSPGHGPVSTLPQAVSNSRVTGPPAARPVSDRDAALLRRPA